MKKPTKAQLKRCKEYWIRNSWNREITYREYRRQCRYDALIECLMVPHASMTVGIETDGYAHS